MRAERIFSWRERLDWFERWQARSEARMVALAGGFVYAVQIVAFLAWVT